VRSDTGFYTDTVLQVLKPLLSWNAMPSGALLAKMKLLERHEKDRGKYD